MATDETTDQSVRRFFTGQDPLTALQWLMRRLPPAAEPVVAGGAVRDQVISHLHGGSSIPADIDLFIGGLPGSFDLAALFRGETFRVTELGGIRWFPTSSRYRFDVSLTANFLSIQKFHLSATIENLMKSFDFDVNAAAFTPCTGDVYDYGCVGAVQRRVMGFNSFLIIDKVLLAFRILLIQRKTGFLLAPKVFAFLTGQLTVENLVDLRSMIRAKEGKAGLANLMKVYDDLCRYGSYDAYRSAFTAKQGK